MMPRSLTVHAVVALAALLSAALPAHASTPAAQALVAQLESADPSLQTYRANVEFNVGLKSFPYVRKTVHGEAFFKRPGRMEIVFTDLPGFAQRFKNLYVGLGTPAEWEKKFEIDAVESADEEGRQQTHLVLTPRKQDRRLQNVAVYIDSASSLPRRIVWTYRDGAIEMKQDIITQNGHSVISAQNADIRLPGVHAFVNAKIANYAINVPVDDAVFTKKPQQP